MPRLGEYMSPERKMLTVTIYLRPEQAARLKALTDATKVPTAVRIREGIDAILRFHSTPLRGTDGY